MQLLALKHLVASAGTLARSQRIVVLGSSSLLASFPELGDDGGPLNSTYDADLLLDPTGKELAAMLVEAIGAGSLFEATQGYHADIVHPDLAATLPPGWETRLVPLEGCAGVFCLDPVDLAAVKIVVGREKDLALVHALLEGGFIMPERLRERFHALPLGEREMFRAGRNFHAVLNH